jgi:LPS-assembly protein
LFKIDKFAGWDRAEGGGRANVGVQYTAQFNRAGFLNVLFGQSYHLFGRNSFATGDLTNTGLDSGLDTNVSDYVARASYRPNSFLTFTSRFRFDRDSFELRRLELEGTTVFDRWGVTVTYGNYDAQPALGFLQARESIRGTTRLKLTPNWHLIGGTMYDLDDEKFVATNLGIGYIDDCVIVSLNYVRGYTYIGGQQDTQTVLLQVMFRTLGGIGTTQILSGPDGT